MSVSLCACLPDGRQTSGAEATKITQVVLGQRTLFIPESYFRPGFSDGSDGTITLQVQYPSFAPLDKSPAEMWKSGNEENYIRILIHVIRSQQSLDDHIKSRIDFFDAYQIVGEEHGLVHRKQPDDYVQDKWDMWIERGGSQDISYVTCTEKLSQQSVPQCTHAFQTHDLYVTVDYDKNNLRNWKTIKDAILALIESFESPETARHFMRAEANFHKETRNIPKPPFTIIGTDHA